MFICEECKTKSKEKDRVFQSVDWCRTCVDKETQRNIKEDSVPGNKFMRTRPPKYMIFPKDQRKMFGY
jgi:hypothetical protein